MTIYAIEDPPGEGPWEKALRQSTVETAVELHQLAVANLAANDERWQSYVDTAERILIERRHRSTSVKPQLR